MADKWEAFLISGPEPDGGMQKIIVEYRKRGEANRQHTYRVDRFTREWYFDFIAKNLESLNFPHETDGIATGKIEIPEPVPVEPSPADTAREAYFEDLRKMQTYKQVAEFKPDVLESRAYTDILSRLAANYDASYFGL